MEEKIENIIDNALSNISPQLNIFSIVIGVVLIILGITLIKYKKSRPQKSKINMNFIYIVIGIMAILSGLLQMIFK